MPDGFGTMLGQVALPLLAVAVGIVLGHLVWPRPPRPRRARWGRHPAPPPGLGPGTTILPGFATGPAPTRPSSPTEEAVDSFTAGVAAPAAAARSSVGPEPAGLIAKAQARTQEAEERLTQAQTRLANVELRLADAQANLKLTRRQLGQADAELVRLRMAAQELADRTELELGRLESGAIAALESAAAGYRLEVRRLEKELHAARMAVREHPPPATAEPG
jgi:hypothetical protein